MKKYIIAAVFVATLLVVGSVAPSAHAAGINGWGWTPNVGWISFSSSTQSSGGGDYGVQVMDSSGNLGGYAWSSNVGWISFNAADLTVNPTCNATTRANLDPSTGYVTGWVRVVAGENRNDGWDGCIELSDNTYFPTGHTDGTRGITYSTTTGNFSGYAWGGNVSGWMTFFPQLPTGPITNPVICTIIPCTGGGSGPSVVLQVQDNLGALNSATTITANADGSVSPVNVYWTDTNTSGITVSTSPNPDTGNIDWPEGNTSTSRVNTPFNVSGNETVSYPAGTVTTSDITKKLVLKYLYSGVAQYSNTVTLTIRHYTAPSNPPCSAPAHATLCPNSTTQNPTGVGVHTYNNNDPICLATTNACQFQCLAGYRSNGSTCSKSSEGEF